MNESRQIAGEKPDAKSVPDPAPGDRPATTGRPRAQTWGLTALALSVIAVCALLLRTWNLSGVSFFFDEACSWKISQFPREEMFEAISRDAHPPLYYLVLRMLGSLVGDNPTVIRGLSVLSGVATVLAGFALVRTVLSDPSARRAPGARQFAPLLGATLLAANALHIEMSMQARPYTLSTLLALVAATFLLRAVRAEGRAIDWGAFTVTAALLSLTHYFGIFSVAAMFLFIGGVACSTAWRTGWSASTRRIVMSLVLSAWGVQLAWAFWLPLFLFQRNRSTLQLWMGPLDWNVLCRECWMALGGGQSSTVPQDWAWFAVAIWGATVLALVIVGTQSERLLAACAGFPLLATVAYSLAVRSILGVRYLIFAQTFVLLSWPLLISRVPWRAVQTLLVVGVLVWMEFWCWQFGTNRERQAQSPGVMGAVSFLEQVRDPREPVIVGSPFIYVVVQQHAAHKQNLFVQYSRDHRNDLLGGPPLRVDEYRDLAGHLTPSVERVWTVDVLELFGPSSRLEVQLPPEWIRVRQEEFQEAYGLKCLLIVREYRRQTSQASKSACLSKSFGVSA